MLNHTEPGLLKTYIPWGIKKIHVRLWGGGGAGDSSLGTNTGYPPASGGGGGFSSCNITVKENTTIYIIVAGGGINNHLNRFANSGGINEPIIVIVTMRIGCVLCAVCNWMIDYKNYFSAS